MLRHPAPVQKGKGPLQLTPGTPMGPAVAQSHHGQWSLTNLTVKFPGLKLDRQIKPTGRDAGSVVTYSA